MHGLITEYYYYDQFLFVRDVVRTVVRFSSEAVMFYFRLRFVDLLASLLYHHLSLELTVWNNSSCLFTSYFITLLAVNFQLYTQSIVFNSSNHPAAIQEQPLLTSGLEEASE